MPYDPVKDFAPIALVLEAEGLLVVHPSVPANNVSELIAYARAKPGKLTFASAGIGTASHLAGELFKTMAKVDMTHVPYKGNVPGDHRPARGPDVAHVSPPCRRSCRTPRPASCARSRRSAVCAPPPRRICRPSAKCAAGFEVNNWIGLFAPAGTPPDIVKRWNGEVTRIMQSPEIQARLPNEGARFSPNTPEQFAAFVKGEIAKWAPVVKASGARVD